MEGPIPKCDYRVKGPGKKVRCQLDESKTWCTRIRDLNEICGLNTNGPECARRCFGAQNGASISGTARIRQQDTNSLFEERSL